jgi:hypothetical protein
MFISLIILGIVVLVLAAALAGFVYVQIKARLIWRLLSIAVVLVLSCWYCSWSVHDRIDNLYSEHYGRGCGEFVEAIDKLTLEGRTNDVHQACQKFGPYFYFSTDEQDITNFDRFVGDTFDLAFGQPPEKHAM